MRAITPFSPKTPVVVLERVSKHYGTESNTLPALSQISVTIGGGEFVSVIGPSGSGKSTLLNLIAGLDIPSEGRVIVGNRVLSDLSDDERCDLRLRHVGFVFQSFNLLPTLTIEENVAWPLEFLDVGWRAALATATEMLKLVGIPLNARDRRPSELSGGEQQRVGIARALVTNPQLLLADEPTGNLDSSTGQAILDLMRRLNVDRNLTVVLVTHSTLAATYGHRTLELSDGRIVRDVRAPSATASGRVVPLRE
jgi:putative ABC transport system ATP-binding protein